MMTADKSIFLWSKNDEWWDFDEKGEVILTSKAPEEADLSFKKYKEYMERVKQIPSVVLAGGIFVI